MDGILGLSPQSKLPAALYNEGVIGAKLLGFEMLPSQGKSYVTFGGIDDSKFVEDPTYFPLLHPLTGTTWWWIDLSVASYKGESFLLHGNSCIIDTGTSLIAMPSRDLNKLSALISDDTKDVTCLGGICHSKKSCSELAPELSDITF